jgi:dTDP-glucose 4,6-dehydratase
MLINAWGRTYDLKYIIVRPTNNYGIGQYVEKLIPKAVKYLMLDRPIPLHNNGTPFRNWLHADDTAEAIMTIIEHGIVGEVYNISGGFEQQNYQTVKAIINLYYPERIKHMDQYIDFTINREGQDVRYSLDDTKLRNLGWEPKKIFNIELPAIVQHYKENFIW